VCIFIMQQESGYDKPTKLSCYPYTSCIYHPS